MSVQTQVDRLKNTKRQLKESIEAKGVAVASDLKVDKYPALIDSISGGEDLDAVIADQTAKLVALEAAVDGKAGGGVDHTVEDALITGSLTDYTNDRIDSVGDYGLAGAGALGHTISLPNVVSCGAKAFSSIKCSEIQLPKLKKCGFRAFDDPFNIKKLYLPNVENVFRIELHEGHDDLPLEYIIAPKAGGKIGPHSFDLGGWKVPLITLVLGEVTSIGSDACGFCPRFKNFVFNCKAVPTLDDKYSLGGMVADGTGYVYFPRAIVDEAKAATNWVTIADQIRAIEDYPEIEALIGGVV